MIWYRNLAELGDALPAYLSMPRRAPPQPGRDARGCPYRLSAVNATLGGVEGIAALLESTNRSTKIDAASTDVVAGVLDRYNRASG
jgi:hypothetical protein